MDSKKTPTNVGKIKMVIACDVYTLLIALI